MIYLFVHEFQSQFLIFRGRGGGSLEVSLQTTP
jgi:hypothetical protein